MMPGVSMHVLPEAIVEMAYAQFPGDPGAIDRLIGGLDEHDLRQLSAIALRDGPEAARRFLKSRPRRLRVMVRHA